MKGAQLGQVNKPHESLICAREVPLHLGDDLPRPTGRRQRGPSGRWRIEAVTG